MSRITIKDIARESGVSTATVSRVLNKSGYASKEVTEKVMAVAEKLQYQPNGIARSLKTQKTDTIGVIIPDISNSYFMTISKGIEDVISTEHYHLLFASCHENPEKERELLRTFLQQRVDALVIATSGGNDDYINEIKQSGVPVVLIDRKLNKGMSDFDFVIEDSTEGAYQLTKKVIEKGHTDIAVIKGSQRVSTGLERYQGYQQAMEEYGIQSKTAWEYDGNFTEEDGIHAVQQFFQTETPPTAVISFNNKMTFGAISELIRMGCHLPDDVLVASYGETEADKILKSSGIIFVQQKPYEMGIYVGEILLHRLKEEEGERTQKIFKPSVLVRE